MQKSSKSTTKNDSQSSILSFLKSGNSVEKKKSSTNQVEPKKEQSKSKSMNDNNHKSISLNDNDQETYEFDSLSKPQIEIQEIEMKPESSKSSNKSIVVKTYSRKGPQSTSNNSTKSNNNNLLSNSQELKQSSTNIVEKSLKRSLPDDFESDENNDEDEEANKNKKRKKSKNNSTNKAPIEQKLEQSFLDLGQKTFDGKKCRLCGMIFLPGQEEDEKIHQTFHAKSKDKSLKWPGFKNERITFTNDFGRIIMIAHNDSEQFLKKFNSVCEIVDEELSFWRSSLSQSLSEGQKAFLFIETAQKKVIGCAIVEAISYASPIKLPSDMSKLKESEFSPVVENKKVEVSCGVSRIWVSSATRRTGIATHLLESIRSNFIYGNVITIDKIAFSYPTLAGALCFKKYCGKSDFPVYK